MKHLTTEELLLLADGELQGDAPAHFESCSECQAALGTLQGRLTKISSALHERVCGEPVESHARSWTRLEVELAHLAADADLHLTREELLLNLDEALPVERTQHLDSCEQCELADFDLRALLSDVEHELRSLIPDEPLERRLAAHEALRREIRPAAEVVEFPMRWSAAYVAAAAAAAFVFAGLWMGQQPVEQPAQIAQSTVEAPGPTAPASVLAGAGEAAGVAVAVPQEAALQRIAIREPGGGVPDEMVAERIVVPASSRPEVFVALSADPRQPPVAGPLAAGVLAPNLLAAGSPTRLRFDRELIVASPRAQPAGIPANTPRQSPIAPASYEDALRVLEGRQLLARAGVWREDVRPAVRGGVLVLQGTVENAATFERLKSAVMRESGGSAPVFDIALRSDSETAGATRRAARATDSPAGGLARSALVEHYRDAARRSFRAASADALDGEIARYVDGVFRSQDQLIEHAYALEQLTADASRAAASDARAASIVAGLADFHVKEAEKLDARIYDQLSEALPRPYWNYRPQDGDSISLEASSAEQSGRLLADVLALEENLTTLFTGSSQTLNVESGERSSGELLHRIHSRLRHLKSLSRESR